MKSRLILMASLIALIALPLVAEAKYSDTFLLGTYSYLQNGDKVHYPNREAMCEGMKALGYNSNIIETAANDPDLSGLLTELDANGLDTWIIDKGWNPDLNSKYRYSLYPLSLSNYQRFEAEFKDESDLKKGDGLDNQYWYAARDDENITRRGRAVEMDGASYGYVWQVQMKKDKPGMIFSDLRYRWPNKFGAYVRFGREFYLYQKNPPSYPDDYLWIAARFRISSVKSGLQPTEPLLRFSLNAFQLVGGGFSQQEQVQPLTRDYMTAPEVFYTYQDYLASKPGDFITLELKVSYADLIAANLLTADLDNNPQTPPSTEAMRLINLNPRVWWYGNCDAQLDFIELEDQIHHDLRVSPDTMSKGIINRMREIIGAGKGNVSGFYTFDEPYLGQFNTFNRLQNISSQAGIDIFTATYDYQADNYVLDSSKGLTYDHVDAFTKIAQPRIIAPDIYPITPEVTWNPGPGGSKGLFIQDVIDRKLLSVYQKSKTYSQQDPERRFFPIVQVLGKWVNQDGVPQWSNWIQPPTATQKALLYLPLCYGADGIIHFRLRGFQTPEGYGDRGAMYSRQGAKTYPLPEQDPVSWPALAETNPRVLAYGQIIKNLDWLGATSVGTSLLNNKPLANQTYIANLKVKDSGKAPYAGYIQCGFFTEANGNPSYMIVNRRGDFLTKLDRQARFIPAEEYAEYYKEADPQILTLEFTKAAFKAFGDNLGLFDPYSGKVYPCSGNKIDLEIPAGEGRLLQLVGILPAKIKGKTKLNGKAVLSGEMSTAKGAKVVLGRKADLLLLPGCRLVIGERGKLLLKGKVTLLGDARISVLGSLDNKAKQLSLGSDSLIEIGY